MKEFSNSSSDRYSNNSQEGASPKTSKRKREGQTEQSSSDATHNNMKLEQHINIFGKKSDQQVGTNETSSSGSDRQSTVLKETDDNKLLLQAADYCKEGKYEKAKLSLTCVLSNCAKEPEQNDLKIDLAMGNLAKIYTKQKRYGDAEELFKFLIEYHLQKSEPDELKIGTAMEGMSHVYMKQGKYKEAKALLKSVILFCKENFKEHDPKTASAVKCLAKVYGKLEKQTKAKALLHEYVLPIFKENFGENDPRTEKVRKDLADLPAKPGQGLVITRGTQRLTAEKWANLLLNYMKRHERFPDICNPQLFNDKQLHRALFDRRPIRTQFQDKYAVRKYVKERIGEEYLPKLLCDPTKDPSTIPFKDLPNKFVIKSNQGGRSSRVIVVTDKSTIKESEIIEECNKWLIQDYYKKTGSARYKNIDQCIMIEEYIDDGKGKAPYDYKFYTYNGMPHFIQVEAGRLEDYSSTFHDTDWNRLQMTHGVGKNSPTPIDKPPHLELILKLAQKLGEDQDFLRIDFYDTPEKVFLGEITSVSGSALERFDPPMYEQIFGEPWTKIHNKSNIQPLGPSPEVCQIIRQITNGMHKSALEGGQSSR